MGIDYNKFEKVSSDKNCTTLRHKDGHELKIAHSALSPQNKKQLDEMPMAKGGDVKLDYQEKGIHHQSGQSGNGQSITGNLVREGKTSEAKQAHKNKLSQLKSMAPPNIQGLAEGGEPDADLQLDEEPAQQAPAPAAQPQQEDFQTSDFQEPGNLDQAVQAPSPMQSAAINYDQAKADHNQDLTDESDKFGQDLVNGHIDPPTYQKLFAKKDTLGKIGTLFGLLVGGAGSGLAHQPNALLHMMDNELQKDFEAQQKSKENAQNFLKINQSDLANKVNAVNGLENAKTAAFARTQGQMYQSTFHNLLQMANKLPPQEQAKYKTALMTMYPELKNKINNINDLASSAMAANSINPFNPHSPNAQKAAPQGQPGEPQAASEHILGPNSDQQFKGLSLSGVAGPNFDSLKEQKAKADLSDKAIDVINQNFGSLENSTGGSAGYLRRQGHNLEKIPYVGPVIDAATNFVTDVPKNRSYDTAYSQIVGAVRGALQGNVSEDLLDKVVKTNTPEENDTPELRKQKMSALKDFIRSHTRTDLLRTYGLSKK